MVDRMKAFSNGPQAKTQLVEVKSSKRVRRVLTQKERYRLWEWLKDNKDNLLKNKPQFKDLAETAKEALSLEWLTASMISDALDVLGFKWDARILYTENREVMRKQMDNLIIRVIALKDKVKALMIEKVLDKK